MRVIAKLDIKQNDLIKSIRYDGVRKIGNPEEYIKRYVNFDIDEIVILSPTSPLYNTKIDLDFLKRLNKYCNIPIMAGGGVKKLNDAKDLIKNGAEKIILNTLFHEDIKETKKIIKTIGSTSVVASIEYKKVGNKYETFHTMARSKTNLNLKDSIDYLEEIEVGEIILNNINNDGKLNGIDEDEEIIKIINEKKNIPFLINGGFISFDQIKKYQNIFSGIIISSALHYGKITNEDIKKFKYG